MDHKREHRTPPTSKGHGSGYTTTNEEFVGVEPITTVIRRWYGHVMRKCVEDWVKNCIEFRVEGRRPAGRSRRTWLENVEADMADLEIDKEDVHDRIKWRRKVMKRNKKNYWKTDYKPIIIIISLHYSY